MALSIKWTEEEIKTTLKLLNFYIPEISVNVDIDDDVGIFIGADDEFVKIEKEWCNKAGQSLDDLGDSDIPDLYYYTADGDHVKYRGKGYTKFQLIASSCYLSVDYFSIKDAVKAAINVYRGLNLIKNELRNTLKDLTEKHGLRLERYIANPQVAKGMDATVAMGVQHGRIKELKLCQQELKDILNDFKNEERNET